jgi:hypothetical protein
VNRAVCAWAANTCVRTILPRQLLTNLHGRLQLNEIHKNYIYRILDSAFTKMLGTIDLPTNLPPKM